MRIAYFVHCFFPEHFYGTETYTLNIAKFMKHQGYDVDVVSAVFPGEASSYKQLLNHYEYEGLSVYCFDKNKLPHFNLRETYYHEAMRRPIRELLLHLKPDIVHVTHLVNHTAVLLEVVEELGIKTVATFTDFFGFCYNNKLQAADDSLCVEPDEKRNNCLACLIKAYSASTPSYIIRNLGDRSFWAKIFAKLFASVIDLPWLSRSRYYDIVAALRNRPDILKKCYRVYAAAIAPSRFLQTAYVNNSSQNEIYLQHFGVNIDRSPKPTRNADENVHFGFIGQIAAHKGVDLLIDAFKNVHNAELHIYGPEQQEMTYTALLKQTAGRCVGKVEFHGTFPPNKMASIMSSLDFLVIPSRWYENSPLVLLYALATHTPVIVSDVEGMTEFVEEGVNGFIFPMGDKLALEKILNQIVKNPAMFRKLSQTTHYLRSTNDMAQDVLDLYIRILRT